MPTCIKQKKKSKKKSHAPSGIRIYDTSISRKGLQPLSFRGNLSGVSRTLDKNETLVTRHLLPGLSDWEILPRVYLSDDEQFVRNICVTLK